MSVRTTVFAWIAFSLVSLASGSALAQATRQSVKHRGALVCGSSAGFDGFGIPDLQGHWTGFDVDFCRAIAAAILIFPCFGGRG